MTLIKPINIPPLEFGRVSTFFDHYKIQLPPSKGLDWTARFNEPFYEYYVQQGGCSTVQVNAGSGVYNALPREFRNTIFHYGAVQNISNNTPWAQYTVEQAKRLAEFNWESLGGVKVSTSNLSEKTGNPARDQYVMVFNENPSAYNAYLQRLDELSAGAGCFSFDDYAGVLNPHVETDIGALRQGLSSDPNSLAFCRARQSGEVPFWTSNGWERQHAIMKHYFGASTDLHTRFIKNVAADELIKGGLRAVNSNRLLEGYYFQDKQEFLEHERQGYSELQITDLGDGIKMYEYTFPGYSGAFMVDELFFGLDIGDRVYPWEDSSLYGRTPGLVEPNWIFQTPDGPVNMRVQRNAQGVIGEYKPTATRQSLPDANRPFPYPGVYEGMKDMGLVGAWFYGRACSWIGGVPTATWNRTRIPGGVWSSEGRTSLADRLEDRKPMARVGRIGSKGYVKIVDYATDSTDPYMLDVDLGGAAIETFEVESGANNLYFFNLAA